MREDLYQRTYKIQHYWISGTANVPEHIATFRKLSLFPSSGEKVLWHNQFSKCCVIFGIPDHFFSEKVSDAPQGRKLFKRDGSRSSAHFNNFFILKLKNSDVSIEFTILLSNIRMITRTTG
jgi:hypothetical protein